MENANVGEFKVDGKYGYNWNVTHTAQNLPMSYILWLTNFHVWKFDLDYPRNVLGSFYGLNK